MKYWRVNVSCNPKLNDWFKERVFNELIDFLSEREYSYTDYNNKSELFSLDKSTFKLRKVWNVEGSILSVFIENKTNWSNSNGKIPQIVHLTSDYFKINSTIWYLLEILTEEENEKINKGKRLIGPIQIKDVFKNWTNDSIPIKPKIIEIGTYQLQQTDIYYGNKKDYDSHLKFWISCLYWNNYGEFEPNELLYHYINNNFYDLECGCCIPMNLSEIEKITEIIRSKSSEFNRPINSYLMRKNWNDKIFLFEYSNKYVLYNWYTAE